ncbi:phosphatase PAP2 family protein [soil metagenome]
MLLYICFAVLCICLRVVYTKTEAFHLLNPYHTSLLNNIFIFFTWLGDGFFIIGLGLLFLILKKRHTALVIISSYLLSGLVAQVLKYFYKEARPGALSELADYKYFIEGVTYRSGNMASFPSGHTASAFALCTVLAIGLKNKLALILLLVYAALVGYSRIYIGQHFLDDVFAGSLIGVVSGIICWMAVYRKTWLY